MELGVPFSDPLGEGPVIQDSSFRALQNGTSLDDCLNAAETLREKIPETPLILMGYYNPIYTYGLVPFAQRCQQAGVDGLIAVDLPGFEAGPLIREFKERDISMIPLLAPTSTDESIKDACSGASGFVYCISVTGVTGAREQVLLALRMGFASRLAGGQPLFLLLDDAFQQSDWERRERLVAQVVELAEAGWQVTYLTMDDHLRDLFKNAGEKAFEDDFNYYEI